MPRADRKPHPPPHGPYRRVTGAASIEILVFMAAVCVFRLRARRARLRLSGRHAARRACRRHEVHGRRARAGDARPGRHLGAAWRPAARAHPRVLVPAALVLLFYLRNWIFWAGRGARGKTAAALRRRLRICCRHFRGDCERGRPDAPGFTSCSSARRRVKSCRRSICASPWERARRSRRSPPRARSVLPPGSQ